MKKLLIILLLTFACHSFTKADDISDFEIEGISLGDSLLDYFSKSKIKNFYNYDDMPSDMKFRIAEFYPKDYKKMKKYDAMQVYYKPEDNNFIVYGINGALDCFSNTECETTYKNVVNDFSKNFDSGKEEKFKLSDDPSGKSHSKMYIIKLSNGDISISYKNWSEETRWQDSVTIEIAFYEIDKWIRNNWGLGFN
jgi:hypothetical protein